MVLETERLLLRPFTREDAEDVFAYASDLRVGSAAGWTPHTDIEDSRRMIGTALSVPGEFAVVLKETGHVIGSVGIGTRPDGRAGDELGYVLSPAYWGRGLMPEAVAAVLEYGFTQLGLHEVWSVRFTDNEQSRRVMEKCGFTYVFQADCDGDEPDGRKIGFYVLLREDWERGRT